MSTDNDEVGVIGQVYVDRRNGKVYKLVGRDRKYKTLSLESENGTSIAMTFSTFRNYLSKKPDTDPDVIKEEAYSEPEITSQELTDVEASRLERKEARRVKKEQKAQEDEEKAIRKREEKTDSYFNKMLDVIAEYTDSFSNPNFGYKFSEKKHTVSIKLNKRTPVVFYARSQFQEVYVVCVPQIMQNVRPSVNIFKCKSHNAKTTGALSESYSIKIEDLPKLLEDHKELFIEILAYKKESED